ncbi:ROK family protein [Microbacterium sp. NPDC076911]|uniref:ROK family protein n=1 Tax=Microbacterium sp. NPDC076911 TaxID=3154958 RepID=UPI003447139F
MGEIGLNGEEVRRQNLAHLLRLLHREGPTSRSRLTEATGLNRSTIADLVGELSRRGIVEEQAPVGTHRVGRPSLMVRPRENWMAIAVNPEIDAVTFGAVSLNGIVALRERIEVTGAPSPAATAQMIKEQIERWKEGPLAEAHLLGIGIAVPGLVRTRDGLVRNAPHLGWRDVPLRDMVSALTQLPTIVDNDATLGLVAEHVFGAAKGIAHVVYLNGGASGIGGGIVVHGQPVRGASGYAGEFGQNRPGILADGDRQVAKGVLEDEVSRARLLHVAGLSSADEPTLAHVLTHALGEAAGHEIARQRRILATALANAVNVLDPEVVVLGGFLATLASTDTEGLATMVRTHAMNEIGDDFELRVAALGEDRLLIGAAEAAFAPLLSDPAAMAPAG